jgi:hypothetical protein
LHVLSIVRTFKDPVIGQLSLELLDTYTDLLPKEAEAVCSLCDDFQRKEMMGKGY